MEEAPYCPALTQRQISRGINAGNLAVTDAGLERWCPQCRSYWPLDSSFWSRGQGKPYNMQSECKACVSDRRRPKQNRRPAEAA